MSVQQTIPITLKWTHAEADAQKCANCGDQCWRTPLELHAYISGEEVKIETTAGEPVFLCQGCAEALDIQVADET